MPEDDSIQMGYAVQVPMSASLGNDGNNAHTRCESTSTYDDTNVWDGYLSYLAGCARDSGAAARSALLGDDSDPHDVDEYVCEWMT